MTYEELKKAYEEMSEKCSLLEKEIQNNKQIIEDKNLEIENLTEQLLKRNQSIRQPIPQLATELKTW